MIRNPLHSVRPGTLQRVVRTFYPYKFQMLLTVLAVFASALLGLLTPLLLRSVVNQGLLRHDFHVVMRDTLSMVAATVGVSVFSLIYGYFSSSVGQHILYDLRNQLYERLQAQSLRFYSETRTGEIQSRLTNDIGGMQSMVSDTAANFLSNAMIVISTLAAMAWLDWRLTLLTLGLLPPFVLLAAAAGRKMLGVRRRIQQRLADLSATAHETLSVSGVLLVKTSGRGALAREQFRQSNWALMRPQIQYAVIMRFYGSLAVLALALTPVLVYWQAGMRIAHGDSSLTLGVLVSFTALQLRLFQPLGGLINVQMQFLSTLALFERVFEYMDLTPEIADSPKAVSLDRRTVRGAVRFEDVNFRYSPGQCLPTLDGITFSAEPGALVALVGPSGAGKTTLTYLLARLYDVSAGRVTIDGHDVREIRLDSLSTIIGMVTQETYLVNNTVRENLRYGQPEASETELIEAAQAAAIHDRILQLPDGYDTIVGERGYKLSGGEKQRIAIARAILKDPRILILDEATSSLDTQSERLIQQALSTLQAGRTTLAIAHRLSTVLNADLILVIEAGRIVEQGTHASLLAAGGAYARLYSAQFEGASRHEPDYDESRLVTSATAGGGTDS